MLGNFPQNSAGADGSRVILNSEFSFLVASFGVGLHCESFAKRFIRNNKSQKETHIFSFEILQVLPDKDRWHFVHVVFRRMLLGIV